MPNPNDWDANHNETVERHRFRGRMKPKVYKRGHTWITWVPGVRVYRFTNWDSAIKYAVNPEAFNLS